MNDCPNAEIRDLLPDLLHAQLDVATRARVEAHVGGCASCRAELDLLRSVRLTLQRGGVRVDVARIVAALPAPPPARDATVVPIASRRRHWADWRIAAAATLLIAGGVSVAVVHGRGNGAAVPAGTVAAMDAAPRALGPADPRAATASVARTVVGSETTATAPGGSTEPAADRELALNAPVSDLSDGQIQALLGAIDRIEAVPPAEPDPGVVSVSTTTLEELR